MSNDPGMMPFEVTTVCSDVYLPSSNCVGSETPSPPWVKAEVEVTPASLKSSGFILSCFLKALIASTYRLIIESNVFFVISFG